MERASLIDGILNLATADNKCIFDNDYNLEPFSRTVYNGLFEYICSFLHLELSGFRFRRGVSGPKGSDHTVFDQIPR